MKIYTKTGDAGQTSLFGGKRVSKDTLRIEVYGTVDELNSILGMCRSFNTVQEIDGILHHLQETLFTAGADLATPLSYRSSSLMRIQTSDYELLEHEIDRLTNKLESLTSFILPGGSKVAAMLHFARAVCRRAERLAVRLTHEEEINQHILIFLNRLSDHLFVLARYANALSGTPELIWKT